MGRNNEFEDTWLILRTSGMRTLPLAKSLRDAGIEAWAPVAQQRHRRPRSDKYRDSEVAVLPTFVFARRAHLGYLLAAEHDPRIVHPPFVVFQRGDTFPLVSDVQLAPLREYEETLAAKWEAFQRSDRIARKKSGRLRGDNARKAYVLGQVVRAPDTPFEGLDGKIVEIGNSGALMLAFEGFNIPVEIDACLVEPIHISAGKSEQTKAA